MSRSTLASLTRVLLIYSFAMGVCGQQKLVKIPINWDGSIEVELGTPARSFKLLLDTGSANTWLKASSLDAQAFNESRSASYRRDGRNWLAGYASGLMMDGELARDTFFLGGLQATGQLFGVCRTTRGYTPALFEYDGALGLGARRRPVVDARDLIENLFRQGQLERPVFSVSPKRGSPGVGGTLVLGGTDEQLYAGEITYTATESHWSFFVDRVFSTRDGREHLISTWREAILDSTSNIISMPEDEHFAFREKSLAIYECASNSFVFESREQVNMEPDLVFQFENRTFTIPGEHLVVELKTEDGETVLYSAVFEGDDKWVLGTPFLRNFYTVYDYANARLGFAELSGGGES